MILRGDNGVERKGQRGRKGWVGEKNLNMHVNPPPTCMESALLSTWGWVQCICSSSLRLLFLSLSLSLFYTFTHRHPLLHTHHTPPHPIHLSTSTHIQVCKNVVLTPFLSPPPPSPPLVCDVWCVCPCFFFIFFWLRCIYCRDWETRLTHSLTFDACLCAGQKSG